MEYVRIYLHSRKIIIIILPFILIDIQYSNFCILLSFGFCCVLICLRRLAIVVDWSKYHTGILFSWCNGKFLSIETVILKFLLVGMISRNIFLVVSTLGTGMLFILRRWACLIRCIHRLMLRGDVPGCTPMIFTQF